MKIKADLAYSELKLMVQYGTLVFTDEPFKNFEILDKELNTVNLTKCELNDLDIENSGSSTYLAYLLQSKNGVKFGLCSKAKIWFNQSGCQNRCQHNGRDIPVRCSGVLNKCSILANKPE